MDITGKNALVTGGAHRVGKGIAMMLARAGANVVVHYHSSADAADETVREIERLGVRALAVQADVGDWRAVQSMAARVAAEMGAIDILVNSADRFDKTPFPDDSDETMAAWRATIDTTIHGPYYLCNAFVPAMQERAKRGDGAQTSGVIVNIVDLAAWRPYRNFAAHSVAKAGLCALTRQLALELAPAIRVNAVAPGNVLPPPHFTQEQIERFAQNSLLQRWGTPDDVASAVRYLVEAEFVTGEILTVDGGEMIL